MTQEERDKHLFMSTIREPGFPERLVAVTDRASAALAQVLAISIISPDAVVCVYGVRLPWHIRKFPRLFNAQAYATHMLRQGHGRLILTSG